MTFPICQAKDFDYGCSLYLLVIGYFPVHLRVAVEEQKKFGIGMQ
jgi:hypothetical protein